MPGFEGEHISKIWSDTAALEIGQIVPRAMVSQGLTTYVKKTLKDYDAQRIRQFRDANVANFGAASAAIVDYVATMSTAAANKKNS
jgi:hypothetical protein